MKTKTEKLVKEKSNDVMKFIEEAKKKSIDLVKRQNAAYDKAQRKKLRKDKKKKSGKAIETTTKTNKTVTPGVPQVQIDDYLDILNRLRNKNDAKSDVETCIKNQNLHVDILYDSPVFIVKSIRHCILERNWENAVQLAILLLRYHKYYLEVVRNLCRLLLKFDLRVKELGLEDRLQALVALEIRTKKSKK